MTIGKLDSNTSSLIMAYLPLPDMARIRPTNKAFHKQLTDTKRLAEILVTQDARFGTIGKVIDLISSKRLEVTQGHVSYRMTTFMLPQQEKILKEAGYDIPENLNFHSFSCTTPVNFMTGKRAADTLGAHIPGRMPADLVYNTRAIHIPQLNRYVLAELSSSKPKEMMSTAQRNSPPKPSDAYPRLQSIRKECFIDHLPRLEAPKKEESKKDGPAS